METVKYKIKTEFSESTQTFHKIQKFSYLLYLTVSICTFLQFLPCNFKILQKRSCWILKVLKLFLKDQGLKLSRFLNALLQTCGVY